MRTGLWLSSTKRLSRYLRTTPTVCPSSSSIRSALHWSPSAVQMATPFSACSAVTRPSTFSESMPRQETRTSAIFYLACSRMKQSSAPSIPRAAPNARTSSNFSDRSKRYTPSSLRLTRSAITAMRSVRPTPLFWLTSRPHRPRNMPPSSFLEVSRPADVSRSPSPDSSKRVPG